MYSTYCTWWPVSPYPSICYYVVSYAYIIKRFFVLFRENMALEERQVANLEKDSIRIHQQTMSNWGRKLFETGTIKDAPRSGRPVKRRVM